MSTCASEVARAEEEREADGEHAAEHQHRPQHGGDDAVGEMQAGAARLRDEVQLMEHLHSTGSAARAALCARRSVAAYRASERCVASGLSCSCAICGQSLAIAASR